MTRVMFLRDTETITASHVCRYSVNHSHVSYTLSLCRWLNLTLQISQGSASTYFRWRGHFRVSFVKGLFRDNSSHFYGNLFIFDRQGAKYKL